MNLRIYGSKAGALVNNHWYQMTRFSLAGTLAILVHYSAMALLLKLAVAALPATATGSVAGAWTNYWLQRRFTFQYTDAHRHTLWRYLLVCGFAWLTNLALFAMFTTKIGLPIISAQLLTSALVATLNFYLYQRLVFVWAR